MNLPALKRGVSEGLTNWIYFVNSLGAGPRLEIGARGEVGTREIRQVELWAVEGVEGRDLLGERGAREKQSSE